MKRLLILTLLCLGFAAAALAKPKGVPEIEFKELSHDFGTLRANGKPSVYEFAYTNTGTAPLALSYVSAPCECTDVEWSRKPIAPGKSAKIRVVYTPDGDLGEFMRTISVWTNIRMPRGEKKKVVLNVSGVVIPEKK